MMTNYSGLRVIVIPDDDNEALSRFPRDLVERVKQNEILVGFVVMYVREATWFKMKEHIDDVL